MKKKTLSIILVLSLLINGEFFSQATFAGPFAVGHTGAVAATDWCGWSNLTPIPFNLEHRGTQNINFLTGGTHRMTIRGTATGTTQGFVGIGGTFSVVGTDPQSILHIHDGNNSYLQVTNGGSTPTATAGVKFGLLNNTVHMIIGQQSTNPLSRIYYNQWRALCCQCKNDNH